MTTAEKTKSAIVINTKALRDAVGLAKSVVPNRPSHPILANLKIEPIDGAIAITGFDLSLGIRAIAPATIEGDIEPFCIGAGLLADVLARVPSESVQLVIEDSRCTLLWGKGKAGQTKIAILAANDYPSLPDAENAESFDVKAGDFKSLLESVLYAASSDESKQILCSVLLHTTNDGLKAAATDGHRLVTEEIDLAVDFPIDALNIPENSVRSIIKMLGMSDIDEMVKVEFSRHDCRIITPQMALTSRVPEGQYPNYQQLIPAKFQGSALFNRVEMVGTLERIAIIADQTNNVMALKIDEDEAIASAEAPDVGDCTEAVAVEASGGKIDIGFNVKYLIEALKNLKGTQVSLNWNSEKSPVVLTVPGATSLALIMPVQRREP